MNAGPPPGPRRAPRGLERHQPWWLLGAGTALALLGVVALVARGRLAHLDPLWLGRTVRGYTAIGLLLGFLAVALALATFLYSARKRSYQETMPWRGTLMAWLWAHVYLGLLALLAATLHGGFGLLGWKWSSGHVLYAVLTLLVASGLAWRLVYRVVPPAAARVVGGVAGGTDEELARSLEVEMAKRAAGGSARLQQLQAWLVDGRGRPEAFARVAAGLDKGEHALLAELETLAARRRRALARAARQAGYRRWLQGWRRLHVPLALLFVVGLLAHVVAVYDLPARLSPGRLGAPLAGFRPANECADCHAAIVEQWRDSMHAHAVTSPVTIVQTNQAVAALAAAGADDEAQLLCNNCHGPGAVLITGQAQPTMPFAAPFGADQAMVDEGVNCVACHQFAAEPASALAAVTGFQSGLSAGRVFFGSLADPVGNAFHQSRPGDAYRAPETLCQSCHNVELDRNGDGRANEPGVDLVLQQTYNEFLNEYDGPETCVTCHMPLLAGERVAETAVIPHQQDYAAPPREVRSHAFVGVDYPLDGVAAADPQRAAREALLQSAARFSLDRATVRVDGNRLTFAVRVANNALGHRLPTGFAFARQMWIEVVVVDGAGRRRFASGALATNTDDLCDTDTMNDALAGFVVGCARPDPQLVNFQQKLVTDVAPGLDEAGNPVALAAPGAVETALQALDGGVVARRRPFDGQMLTRIAPHDDERVFFYEVVLADVPEALIIETRLRFRNLPPYFLRALAAGQDPASDEIQLAPLIENVQIVDMAGDRVEVVLR